MAKVVTLVIEVETVEGVMVDEGRRSNMRLNVCSCKMLLVAVVVEVSELVLRQIKCCRKHNLCIYICEVFSPIVPFSIL